MNDWKYDWINKLMQKLPVTKMIWMWDETPSKKSWYKQIPGSGNFSLSS